MSEYQTSNRNKIWGWALAIGVIAFIILKFLMSYAFWPALFLAILIALLVALLIWLGWYRNDDGGASMSSGSTGGSGGSASAGASSGTGAAASSSAGASSASTAASQATASAQETAPAPEPAPEPAPKPEPAPEPASAPATGTVSGAAPMQASKPQGLSGARDGGADDLKKIKGVGPKLEKLLNSMGFYHFDQIAEWGASDVAWVDENLQGFKGRVSRDNWVDQARTLAEGGETAFSKKVDEGDVY